MGHPLDSLAWLASNLAARGHGLKPGDLVAAGTCTGLHLLRPPSRVLAPCCIDRPPGCLGVG